MANEEVVAGACERCGGEVEKRDKEQWMIAITKYADRLLEDLETVDYLPKIKKQQQDWIGKSVGAEVDFRVDIGDDVLVSTGNASKLERNQFWRTCRAWEQDPDSVEGITPAIDYPDFMARYEIITRWTNYLCVDDFLDALEGIPSERRSSFFAALTVLVVEHSSSAS